MSLWNIIRDWFVQNIFGGMTSAGAWSTNKMVLGMSEQGALSYTDSVRFTIGNFTLTMGDWLSSVATLIVLIAVCLGLYCLTRYFFRMFAGLLSGR